MNNYLELFKGVDNNIKYTPQQLQNFFLGIKSQIYELNNIDTNANQVNPQKQPNIIPESLLKQDVLDELDKTDDKNIKSTIKDLIKTILLANHHHVDEKIINELIGNFNSVNWDNISNYKEAVNNIFDSVNHNTLSSTSPVTNESNISNISPIVNESNITNASPVINKINSDKETFIEQNLKKSELLTNIDNIVRKDIINNNRQIDNNYNQSNETNKGDIKNTSENIINSIENNAANVSLKNVNTPNQNIENNKTEIEKNTDNRVSSILDKEELTNQNILSVGDNLQEKIDVIFRNKGGDVPGEGDKDTVPAMLTPGEYVVNKSATEQYRPFLESLNSGVPPKNIIIDKESTSNIIRLNEGGIVKSHSSPITTVQNKEISKDINETKNSEAIQNMNKQSNNQSSESEDTQTDKSQSPARAGSEGYDNIRDPAYLMRMNAWERISGGTARVNTI